jgi:hypothetical protein
MNTLAAPVHLCLKRLRSEKKRRSEQRRVIT